MIGACNAATFKVKKELLYTALSHKHKQVVATLHIWGASDLYMFFPFDYESDHHWKSFSQCRHP